MGQVCPKYEEALISGPTPGLAKRHANYLDVAERGGAYHGAPLSRLDVMRAQSQGTPQLSDGARSLLGFYLSHLNTQKLGEGQTSVWPGNASAAEALGKRDPTIRRLKGELERAGYLLRNYDRRNRPMEGDAIDLGPFLAQIPEILRDIDQRRTNRRAQWQQVRKADQTTQCAKSSGEALKIERQNSPLDSLDSCLEFRGFEKEKEESSGISPQNQRNSSKQEAKQSINDAKIINQALDLSPSLKQAINPEEEGVSTAIAATKIWAALPGLFPSDSANSISHTFLWCAKRHGAKAFLYLAIALEDPMTKDPRKLFGWFATNPEKIDISRNLERIKHKPKPVQPEAVKPRLPGNGFEDEIALAIARKIGIPAYNAWFDPASIRFKIRGETLMIEHGSAVARSYLNQKFNTQLRFAAQSLDLRQVQIRELE